MKLQLVTVLHSKAEIFWKYVLYCSVVDDLKGWHVALNYGNASTRHSLHTFFIFPSGMIVALNLAQMLFSARKFKQRLLIIACFPIRLRKFLQKSKTYGFYAQILRLYTLAWHVEWTQPMTIIVDVYIYLAWAQLQLKALGSGPATRSYRANCAVAICNWQRKYKTEQYSREWIASIIGFASWLSLCMIDYIALTAIKVSMCMNSAHKQHSELWLSSGEMKAWISYWELSRKAGQQKECI